MENALLKRAIIETISFFSLFEYPLTASELARWFKSNAPVSEGEIFTVARAYVKEEGSQIGFKNGFFFLCGHEQSIEYRMQNFLTHISKFLKARRAARCIAWIPFVRMIAICNTVAMSASKNLSDIDFFIVSKAGRLWLVRLFTVLILHCARLRRHGRYIANRICLSFYVADDSLNLSPMCLPEGDIYLTYWPTQLVLLFNKNATYETFARENIWVQKILPNADFLSALSDTRIIKLGFTARGAQTLSEYILGGRFGDLVEKFCRFLQRVKMSTARKGARPVENAVVISDTVLKFHEHDRRQEFQDLWKKQITYD